MRLFISLLLACGVLAACQPADNIATTIAQEATPTKARIVSLSGTLTELLYDLDYGDQIVGVDVTSTFPSAAASLPKLGHVRQLNVEGVLELQPTLIFIDADVADNAAIRTLGEAGIEIVPVPSTPTLDNAAKAAEVIGEHLVISDKFLADYQDKIHKDSLALAEVLSATTSTPRTLFIYARGAKQLMVAGADTEASAMIELAGGTNAITSFKDFKPLTPESLVEAAPDVILMFTSGLASLDGKAGLANIPGIDQTPAYKNDRIIAMDGHYLLGFGPRAAKAAKELARSLHNNTTK